MSTRFVFMLAAVACGLALAAPARGQNASGAGLTGEVDDAAHRPIPGAVVAAENTATGQSWTAATDARGRFRLLALPVGAYSVTAVAPGFAAASRDVTLALGVTLNVAFELPIASVSEKVTVSAAEPIVDVVRTETAQAVSPREVQQLPLNGRNYLDLALLTPGVSRTNTGTPQRFAETSAVPGTGISISSQRNLDNSFIVDGLSANDDAAGLAGTFFSQDVIREFQVITSGPVAEFGRASAGIINIVTKSGTNQAHGDAYGFFRNDRLDARNPLSGRNDPLDQEQVGGSFAGPLQADRTFLFTNLEGTHNHRTGIVTIAPGDAAAIDAATTALDGRAPVETGGFTTGFSTLNGFVRVDRNWSPAARSFFRYNAYHVTSRNARSVGGLNAVSRGAALNDLDQTGAFSFTSSAGASALHELRVAVTRSRLDAPVNDPIGPAVNIAGVASFGTSTVSPTGRDLDVYEAADTWTLQRGAHLVKLGGDGLLNRVNIVFPGPQQGAYTFASLDAFDSGQYINFQQAFGPAAQFQNNPNLGLFAEDEWRAGRGVTLNAGLRYDLQWLPGPIRLDANNVSPRVGVAWAPGDGLMVVRGNTGLFFDRIPLRATSNALQRGGAAYRTAVLSFGEAGAPAFPGTLRAFPADTLTSISTIDPRIQDPSSVQTAVTVERALGAKGSIEAGYRHVAARGLIMSRNVNVPTLTTGQAAALGVPNLGRPDPSFANIVDYESLGRSSYDALDVSLRADGSWYHARLAYTLSRAMDDAGNFFFSQPQDANDVEGDRGPSDNDQRHRLTFSGTVTTPARAGAWLGGWQVSGIMTYASPLPFNVQTGTDRNHDTNVNDRPTGVGRNSARGFDYASLDLRLSRTIPAGAAHVEALVEAFNLLNRANFAVPNDVVGTGAAPLPTFGQPTAAFDPRQVQLGLRWAF